MKTFSDSLFQQLKNNIGGAMQQYFGMHPDERQKLEEQGVTLSNFVFEAMAPIINNIKLQNILIVMEEGIGNMVMLTPMLKLLRKFNPRLKITVWGKEPSVQVIRGWDVVDNVITEFDYKYYDLCFFTLWSGKTREKYGKMLAQYIRHQFEGNFILFHEAVQHLGLVEFLGDFSTLPDPHCQQATDNAAKAVDKFMETEGIGEYGDKFIVFGDTILKGLGWEPKRWPHFDELAELIRRKFPEYKILLIGDEEDKVLFSKKSWPSNVSLEACGKFNIPQLAYLLSKCDFYVGNDTGPTHIAAAIGVKTYAIFGPTHISKNKPLGKDVTIIKHLPSCAPCQYTDRWHTCSCLNDLDAKQVYDEIFFPTENKKKKLILVGVFSPDAHRNEIYIKRRLERDFKFKVIPFEYRVIENKVGTLNMNVELVNKITQEEPDYVLICGGTGNAGTGARSLAILPQILVHSEKLSPKTKIYNWYVDNRGQVEEWFKHLSSVCHRSFWSTGDPVMLSQVFSQTQRLCEFMPIVPDHEVFFPKDNIEKNIDVLFVGTAHSKDRVELIDYLISNGINVQIYGEGWPKGFNAQKPIFDNAYNDVLNRSKIVINQNIVNNVPLYFSDRYFFPMATKTVGLNMHIPQLEDMFEDGKHMVFWKTKEECLEKIKQLLADDSLRTTISEEGYKLYKEKYTLKHILEQIYGN